MFISLSSTTSIFAEAKAEMGAGNKVQITENAGKWYYIELGETGGWCKAENIIIIK